MPIRSILRSFAHRNFRLFFAGQCLSLVGTQVQIVALPWFVYRLTDSPEWNGWVAFAGQFPAVFATPLAGVIADRVNKRRLLLVTQSLAMIQAGLLAALTLTDLIDVWYVLFLSIGLSLVNAFDLPTRQAMLNEMVESREDLGNAIALNSAMFNVTRLVGPSLAALLIASPLGEGGCFAVNALSFLAVILALWAMRLKPRAVPQRQPSAMTGLWEGVRFAMQSMPIRSLLLLVTVVSFLAVPYSVLVPVLVKKVLQSDEWLNGWIFSAFGLGALTGGLFLASRHGVLGLVRMIWLLPLVGGLALLGISLTDSVPLTLGLFYLLGLSVVMTLTTCNMVLQTISPDVMRGRILSLYALTFMGMAPLGSLAGGWLAKRIGVQPTVRGAGVALAAAAIAFGLTFGARLHQRVMKTFTKDLRKAEADVVVA